MPNKEKKIVLDKREMIIEFIKCANATGYCSAYIAAMTYQFVNALESECFVDEDG